MIEHVSLRCSDARKSGRFYEKALAPLGYVLSKREGGAFGFRHGGRHDFWVTGGDVGTPGHVAFHADDRAAVDAFHEAALAAGGTDNGAPGLRADYGYAAFVLDRDGHNIEAVVWLEELPKPARAKKPPAKKRPAPSKMKRTARRTG